MNAKNIIEKTAGKIFTVLFIKKDGTTRKLNCRLGVKRYLHGGNSTTAHIDNLITVYDLKNNGYRNINIDKVIEIRANNKIYK